MTTERKRWRAGADAPAPHRPDDYATPLRSAERLLALDQEISGLAARLREAHAEKYRTGAYAPRGWYAATTDRLEQARLERRALQVRMEEEYRQAKQQNIERLAAAHASDDRRFVQIAKATLPAEQYAALWQAVSDAKQLAREEREELHAVQS